MFISDDPHRTDNHSRARNRHHGRRRLLPRRLSNPSSCCTRTSWRRSEVSAAQVDEQLLTLGTTWDAWLYAMTHLR